MSDDGQHSVVKIASAVAALCTALVAVVGVVRLFGDEPSPRPSIGATEPSNPQPTSPQWTSTTKPNPQPSPIATTHDQSGPTHEKWAAQSTAMCKQAQAEMQRHFTEAENAPNVEAQFAAFGQGLDVLYALSVSLRAVPGPTGTVQAASQMSEHYESTVATYNDAIVAISNGDLPTAQAASAEAVNSSRAASRIAAELGVPACSFPVSPITF